MIDRNNLNSLCRVSKGGVEVLRADQEQKVWVVKGSQWKSGIRALVCDGDSGRSFRIYLGILSASEVRCTKLLQAVVDQGRMTYRTHAEGCSI